jgi:hypothetical protein
MSIRTFKAGITTGDGKAAGTIILEAEIRGADGKTITAAAAPAPAPAAPPMHGGQGNIQQNMYAAPPPQAAAPPPQAMSGGMLSENELFQIWNVLDNDRSGSLSKPEMVKVGAMLWAKPGRQCHWLLPSWVVTLWCVGRVSSSKPVARSRCGLCSEAGSSRRGGNRELPQESLTRCAIEMEVAGAELHPNKTR